MKAITIREYGPPDVVLKYEEVDTPEPGPREVLVKARASSLNAADWRLMRADPFLVRLAFGLRRPRIGILGIDLAGTVDKVGREVTAFKPGDAVFGDVFESGFGAFAEYVRAREDNLVPKPPRLSFEQAAAVPLAAVSALQGLRLGGVGAGARVLINGGSSGVGSFAVQIAKALGAEVTATCGEGKVAAVSSLGPDRVVDYTKEDVTKGTDRFDLILDNAAYRSVFDYKAIMKPGGRYVMVGGDRFLEGAILAPLTSLFGSKAFKMLSAKSNRADLLFIADLLTRGAVTPLVDRTFPLRDIAEAVRYLEGRHAVGKVVLTV